MKNIAFNRIDCFGIKTVKVVLYIVLFAFLAFDLSNSFKQFCVARLDGDILESTLLLPAVQKTMDDPTGIKTIINNDKHSIPNRFFSHYFLHKTMSELPLFLQKFYEPIDSVYLSGAIAKLAMQMLLLFLLAVIVIGKCNPFSLNFIIASVFFTSFFQTNGRALANEIGIIHGSISYSFFYPMPLVFLLSYYVPLFLELLHSKKMKMNLVLGILWAIFAIISCFSGPLNSPIILITNLILFVYLFIKNWRTNENKSFSLKCVQTFKNIPRRVYLFLLPIAFLSLYSIFLGTFNSDYSDMQLSLKEMYAVLPKGIWNSFFTSVSFSMILFLLLANYLIIRLKYKDNPQSEKIVSLYKFLILFGFLYVLLLPLGGYRPYRPLILRFDTILPITILSMITICYGFLFILKRFLSEKWTYYLKTIYPLLFLFIVLFFTFRDNYVVQNECERASLYLIAQSKEEVVVLENNCAVVGWGTFSDPEESTHYGELLYFWKITDTKKRWYNLPE